jgi:hypothetical protein
LERAHQCNAPWTAGTSDVLSHCRLLMWSSARDWVGNGACSSSVIDLTRKKIAAVRPPSEVRPEPSLRGEPSLHLRSGRLELRPPTFGGLFFGENFPHHHPGIGSGEPADFPKQRGSYCAVLTVLLGRSIRGGKQYELSRPNASRL